MVVIGSNTRFSRVKGKGKDYGNGGGKARTKAPGPYSDRANSATTAEPSAPVIKKVRRKFRWVKDEDGFETKVPITPDDDAVSLPASEPVSAESFDWAEDVANDETASASASATEASSSRNASEKVVSSKVKEVEIDWEL
ncbi:hypothetical protein QBC47DRAFT_417296 [Echria macrotheca]|uniref:Uncharacterized protein n=1 Tax=Echria macrotheca TaxID=438768 RepID=A0AAJ0F2P9_9PEZI|nr:hypothetical protein QBC47DRAFT_417296 [Echria macrotheca]